MTTGELTIARPDDFHLHLRDGLQMADVMRHSAERFGRGLIMPNLKSPVTTVNRAVEYRSRILEELLRGFDRFEPLMTLYLTDRTSPKEIIRAKESGFVKAVKLYPAGATTNSNAGVTDLRKVRKTLEWHAKSRHGALCTWRNNRP